VSEAPIYVTRPSNDFLCDRSTAPDRVIHQNALSSLAVKLRSVNLRSSSLSYTLNHDHHLVALFFTTSPFSNIVIASAFVIQYIWHRLSFTSSIPGRMNHG